MNNSEETKEIPSHVLTALEDLAFEISDLQELMLEFAVTANELNNKLPHADACESVH